MTKILVDKDRFLAIEETCKRIVKRSEVTVGTEYISSYEQASQKTSSKEKGA